MSFPAMSLPAMTFTAFTTLLRSVRAWIVAAVVTVLVALPWAQPAFAINSDAAASSVPSALQQALDQTKDPQRLADLQQLQQALEGSDDRAQITNASTHNLGVFARYKKDAPEALAEFYVLAPGHQTDDDYDILAVLIPGQVGLRWSDSGSTQAASAPRLLQILDGEQLSISDPAEGADADLVYQLSLPAFQVESRADAIASLPQLSQAELDQSPESAPLD